MAVGISFDSLPHTGTLWFCTDCLFAHAYDEFPDKMPAGEPEPLSLIRKDESVNHVTMGMLTSDHATDCTLADRDSGSCECAVISFGTSRCDGCGSYLHGERHAFVAWLNQGNN